MKLEDYYILMGIPEQEIEKLMQFSVMPSPSMMMGYSFAFLFLLIGYLIYVKKFYRLSEKDAVPVEA